MLRRLNGGLGANLASELEAVGQRRGGGVNSDGHLDDCMRLNALAKRRPGEIMDL